MSQEFQKPFAAPPTIFLAALIVGVGAGLLAPIPVLPFGVQIAVGPLIVLGGIRIIARSIRDIETAGTTYDPFAASTELVTSGIYRFTRNPGYLGLAIIQTGLAVLLDNPWILLTGLVAVIVTTTFVIRLEERKLEDAFGEAYAAYRSRVRRWI